VYICGRQKDLIIINGKNYYPQDIERIASNLRGVREDQCVAFSHLDANGKERCVLVAEVNKRGDAGDDIPRELVLKVRRELGLTVDEVVLIKRNCLPKTSSGKVRRRETKARFENDTLELVDSWRQPGAVQVPTPRRSSPAAL
jgi:fatty-acyl-CoA synthase